METLNHFSKVSVELPLACPVCKAPLFGHAASCPNCTQQFSHPPQWIDLCLTANEINDNTEAAYKHYSRFYAPIALLAYLIVWRGNFFKHVKFFRELLTLSPFIVDVATGDGSLTQLALYGSRQKRASEVLAIDISGNMLLKARQKMTDPHVTLVRGDVNQLPLPDSSVKALSCFGGFNSFPDGFMAMKELYRVMKKNGVIRGSVLLMPKTPWRKRLVLDWIQKGYQTGIVTEDLFLQWVSSSGFALKIMQRYGDVILFELQKV